MNDAMATRLRQIRQKRGYRTAKGAAEAMGMKYPTYSEHERNGEMRYSSVLKYARFFRVPPDWLLHGGEEKEILTKELQKDDLGLMQVKRVPLFDLADLDHFMQIRAKAAPYSEKSAFMPKSENVPPRLFSTKVGDKSMTQTVAPSLPAGTTIFVDPDADPQPGEMVLAVIEGFDAGLVRHYARALVDGVLQVVLTPFNPAFETIRFKPDEKSFIVGPVVNALLSFRQ